MAGVYSRCKRCSSIVLFNGESHILHCKCGKWTSVSDKEKPDGLVWGLQKNGFYGDLVLFENGKWRLAHFPANEPPRYVDVTHWRYYNGNFNPDCV